MSNIIKQSGVGVATAGLFIAVGLGTAAGLLGHSLVEMRRADRIVSVKGLSEREVEANVASWRLPFRGGAEERKAAVAEAIKARDTVIAFAEEGGLQRDELTVEPFTLRVERNFLTINGEQREQVRYVASGAVRLRSENIGAIASLTTNTPVLLDRGVLLGEGDYGETPRAEYIFTGINEIKPEMIAEATQSARQAAQRFAEDSGSSIGKIASANQGVVQFLARDGNYDERFERHKVIRVVSSVRYQLVE
ncbi:SIMPL domain-containing protein [Pelagibius sp. Alg239-R121]|uniref:SIMPL domain-containing protein n=1 Tax=Pelagibius sp. Alg239-R121 TaxID=2993448 RepID=UPI0024A67F64|nr:SIMPL domain-containing protein [Pelagibius sp. Alg239-R121]